MNSYSVAIEVIGWLSTASFLISIVVPNRVRLHQLGIFASVTTGVYAYAHGATAIWVKWLIAFFFHAWMIYKTSRPTALALEAQLGSGQGELSFKTVSGNLDVEKE